jgi:hypothetical protein
MRYSIFAVLVVLPVALVGWIFWRGSTDSRHSRAEAAASAPAAASAESDAKAGEAPDDAKRDEKPESTVPGPPAAADDDAVLRELFAPPLAGATAGEPVELYDDKGLFDYIDGAAPIFLERGFRMLGAAEMSTEDGGDLTCDIYDMRTPENAESIFEAERSDAAQPVPDWPGAIAGKGSFVFHHGRYYVKLTAFDPASEAVLPALAAALRDRMK